MELKQTVEGIDTLKVNVHQIPVTGELPVILLRGVNPASEAEIREEERTYGACFLDPQGRIISPEFVRLEDGAYTVDTEKAKLATARTLAFSMADNGNRRYHVISNGKPKKQAKPVVRIPTRDEMPTPKLITLNVWRALSQMGML
jgi:hypothetical protein